MDSAYKYLVFSSITGRLELELFIDNGRVLTEEEGNIIRENMDKLIRGLQKEAIRANPKRNRG